ncbi:MAG: hypothetical protein ACD_82C00191G0001 [uncultured bacterium]|nr:MAG: hypothetical protein ACD_82C00191G0001 [uncultured bacterium]KKP27098.1 MAG: Lipoprotein releasing system, transmembrane protein, LolC/E family [candidate division TM6 bacterium GW2011_GWF2_30_66]
MKNLPLFLAWRYLIGAKKEKSISTMVIICFLGIFIGTFALSLIASIMNGFETVTHEKIKSINPQIIMHSNGQELNFAAIKKTLNKDFPEIEACTPNSTKQLIAQKDDQNEYSLCMLRAIDPSSEQSVCDLESKIINNNNSKETNNSQKNTLAQITSENKVIIGSSMAENLNVKVGDKINLFFSENKKIRSKKIKLDQETVTIGGIFKTGIEEFDIGLIISTFELFNKIFPETGVTQISIKLKPGISEEKIIKNLRNKFYKFGINFYSWKELYPALVEALKLEKYAMFLILALITLVASMNIISLLFMQIIQKRGDIAILKSMGLSGQKISQIFFYLGMTVSIVGSIVGLIFSFIAGWFLENYPFITLPDAYYVTYLPAKMEWQIFAIVFVVVFLISFLSTWIPTRKTRKINISQVLRFES